MSRGRTFHLVRRALRLPPRALAHRARYELGLYLDRRLAPRRHQRFDEGSLLRAAAAADLGSLWRRLASRPYPFHIRPVDAAEYEALCPGDGDRIRAAGEEGRARRVRLLGSGTVELGDRIDWSRDYVSGATWPRRYVRDIRYVDPGDDADVKWPWELSRLQWLIPVGQLYLLTGDEAQAAAARQVIEDWIAQNPCAQTVNWGVAMEAALRVLTWTWLFRVFQQSPHWAEAAFQSTLLRALYLHGDFIERHAERSDVNGNHYTADLAGLTCLGLFFGEGAGPLRWQDKGWQGLCREITRQVSADGVDFEASTAYHRLVLELFLLPALYRRACGLDVPAFYRDRLIAMGTFVAACSRPDGSVPLWGDADDGRALPLGGQGVNDHRYLVGVLGAAWDAPELRGAFSGPPTEIFWLLGPEAARPRAGLSPPLASAAFPQAGVYVMRRARDHVFIDGGPVGMAGRGGHGHNDCLSLEAVLEGAPLITDCGTFTYTRSFRERNFFRSTAAHNTPQVDGQEINRFVHPEALWSLHDDARPEIRRWEPGGERDVFCGSHAGYLRLRDPVRPVRTIVLDHVRHALVIADSFEAAAPHRYDVRLHLAPGVGAQVAAPGEVGLRSTGRPFRLSWAPADVWRLALEPARVSPSYGVALPALRLTWTREGPPQPGLLVCLRPEDGTRADDLAWARDAAEAAPPARARRP